MPKIKSTYAPLMPGRIMLDAARAPSQSRCTHESDIAAVPAVATRYMPVSPAAAGTSTDGRAPPPRRHSSGAPPKVSPMKRLYMAQRCSVTRATTTPEAPSSAVAMPTPRMPRNTTVRVSSRRRVTPATAPTKRS